MLEIILFPQQLYYTCYIEFVYIEAGDVPVEAVVVCSGRSAAVVLQVAAGVSEPLSVPRVAQHGPRLHRAPRQGA